MVTNNIMKIDFRGNILLHCQDNRNRLMHIDYAKQTPRRLFQDWNCDHYDIFVEINRTPQNKVEGNNLLQARCNPKVLFITSPSMRRTTPIPPNAPIKFKKHFSKEGLKPKKLRFTDKEEEEIENRNLVQKTTDCATKIFNHKSSKQRVESKGELKKEKLNAMLQDIRLETDNKENIRPREKEHYERKVKNNRSVFASSSKNIDNSAQSSKSSYNIKETVRDKIINRISLSTLNFLSTSKPEFFSRFQTVIRLLRLLNYPQMLIYTIC